MNFSLEIDWQTLHHLNEKVRCPRLITTKDPVLGSDRVIISFIQVFFHPGGYPLGISRFPIVADWDMIFAAETDPTILRVFVEYDQYALVNHGLFHIKDVGFCTASYRPSEDEAMDIFTLPDLLRIDACLKANYDHLLYRRRD